MSKRPLLRVLVALSWVAGAAVAQSSDPAILRADGTLVLAAPEDDLNADAWPDNPFTTLADGE